MFDDTSSLWDRTCKLSTEWSLPRGGCDLACVSVHVFEIGTTRESFTGVIYSSHPPESSAGVIPYKYSTNHPPPAARRPPPVVHRPPSAPPRRRRARPYRAYSCLLTAVLLGTQRDVARIRVADQVCVYTSDQRSPTDLRAPQIATRGIYWPPRAEPVSGAATVAMRRQRQGDASHTRVTHDARDWRFPRHSSAWNSPPEDGARKVLKDIPGIRRLLLPTRGAALQESSAK